MQKWLFILVLLAMVACTTDPATEFEKAKAEGTPRAYSQFLAIVPESEFKEEAMQLLEESHFRQIKKDPKYGDIEVFLIKFPNGKFASQAQLLMTQLSDQQ